jgi:hypothetical protein
MNGEEKKIRWVKTRIEAERMKIMKPDRNNP